MGKLKITDFYLYRWRYPIGFTLIGALLLVVLFVVGFLAPNGLSKSEMASVVASVHTPLNVVQGLSSDYLLHLPYRLLQKLSITTLGFDQFAIKLPSLLMALGSILMLYGVTRLWFKRSTAIITSIIAVSSSQFLLQAQLGTPAISYLFWSLALLFFTSVLARTRKYRPMWLIGATIAGGLSLYSPLMVYVILALGITSIMHPHARFIIFRQSPIILILGMAIFLLVITPLIMGLISSPQISLQLLGVPSDLSAFSWSHIIMLLEEYVGFHQPASGETIRPAYGLPIVLIALIGAVKLFTATYTAKSYILSIWFLCLVPIVLLQNSIVAFTFVPIMLLVAFGVDYLAHSWYRLFPQNPYARIAGLLPLSVLVFGITFSGLERFVYGYHYSPEVAASFSQDLSKVRETVRKNPDNQVILVVPTSQKEFYTAYATSLKTAKKPTVVDTVPTVLPAEMLLVVNSRFVAPNTPPSGVLVSGAHENANRFYLYKNGYN